MTAEEQGLCRRVAETRALIEGRTPDPWRAHGIEPASLCGPDGRALADFNAKSRSDAVNQANADFALRAIGMHRRLVQGLRELLEAFETSAADMDPYEYDTIIDNAKAHARHLLRDAAKAEAR